VTPDAAGAGAAVVVGNVARFGRALRAAGLDVGPSQVQDAVSALASVDVGSREQCYWALRCTLTSSQEHAEVYDRAFASFWERGAEAVPVRPGAGTGAGAGAQERAHEDSGAAGDEPESREAAAESGPRAARDADARLGRPLAADARGSGDNEDEEGARRESGTRVSALERLARMDFARYSERELRDASRLLERIASAAPVRRSRRQRAARDGRVFDKRQTLRAAMRTEGYPLACRWRRARVVPRKLVFLVDISGSMQPYARVMVMFMQGAVRAHARVEAFTFGTRLTRVTRELHHRDREQALRAAAALVHDWAGGTRIGENLAALNQRWGPLGITRGAVVIIVSDGWERGDPTLLGQEMERLHRMAHTVIWVNPLSAEPGYAPLAKGMAAAIPHLDYFLPGHNLRSLETLAEVLESLPSSRRARPATPAARV
jgi:uncharacterized protein with von Willebrand factor type A (vWA) domain